MYTYTSVPPDEKNGHVSTNKRLYSSVTDVRFPRTSCNTDRLTQHQLTAASTGILAVSKQSLIWKILESRMRRGKHTAKMGDIRNAIKILVGEPKGKDHLDKAASCKHCNEPSSFITGGECG
jgi:hypothetical protein